MKKFVLLALSALLAAVLFCGCAGGDADYLKYVRGGFECEIAGEVDGVGFAAHVVCGAPRKNAESDGTVYTERECTVEFSQPESMKGVRIVSDGEKICASLDGVEIENAYLDGFMFPVEALCPDGEITGVELVRRGDREVNMLSLGVSGEHSIFIDSTSDLPVRVEAAFDGRRAAFEVLWLEISD